LTDSPATVLTGGKTLPPAVPVVQPRPRLERQLAPGLGQLVLLHAPAGFGKSLALLGAPGPYPRAWYNADATDGDAGVFARRLAHLLGVRRLVDPASDSAEGWAAALATGLPAAKTTLDIDSGERIAGSHAAGSLLAMLLELAGDRLAIRLATRSRPAMPLERLGLAGRLEEVGLEDLRFDLDETRLFIEEVIGLAISAAEVQAMHETYEGWPAGLALDAMQRGAGVAALRPQDRAYRYMAEEVFAGLPNRCRELLLHLPAGARFDQATIAELTGLPAAGAALDWLLREHFFVVPEGGAYRLHAALAAFLARQERRAPRRSRPAAPAGDTLNIRTLGRFEVTPGGGSPVARWRPAGARRLLQLLLSRNRYQVGAEQAAEVLWPGSRRDSAMNSFDVSLHALRRLLEPGLKRGSESRFIVRDGRSYRLRTDEVEVDADRFGVALSLAQESRDPADYEIALQLYTGDFLADVVYDDFPHERREHLKVQYLEGLEELGRLHLAAGATDEGLARLRRLLEMDPCREDVWALVIESHLGRGERAAAARVYQKCELALRSALGVSPGPALDALLGQIHATPRRVHDELALVTPEGSAGVPAIVR